MVNYTCDLCKKAMSYDEVTKVEFKVKSGSHKIHEKLSNYDSIYHEYCVDCCKKLIGDKLDTVVNRRDISENTEEGTRTNVRHGYRAYHSYIDRPSSRRFALNKEADE